jgi:hypothetical protein
LWALAALAAGCSGGALGTPPCSGGSCGTQVSVQGRFQYSVGLRVDLLFVVDDTPAMAPYLDRVATGLAQMAAELVGTSSRPLNLHVGFVRAGGCDASTRAGACGVNPPEQFLRSEWCNTMTNDSLAFVDAFTCLGAFGAASCGPAQPLAAALHAVADPPDAGWETFLRADAYLMVVVIAAQDDASGPAGAPTPILDLATRLKAVKADPSQIVVSVIGPGDCGAGDTFAARLTAFVNEFGANGLVVGLCSEQLPAALHRVTETVSDGLQPPCLEHVRDTDPRTPGLQSECTVVENIATPDHSVVSQSLPSCDVSAEPCWNARSGMCGNGRAGALISIVDASDRCLEGGGNFTIECLGCADATDPACLQQ